VDFLAKKNASIFENICFFEQPFQKLDVILRTGEDFTHKKCKVFLQGMVVYLLMCK